MARKYSFESHSIILKLWTVRGLLANTECIPKNWRAFFPPESGLERSRLSLDSLQKLGFSSCRLFGFSQPPGLMISWKARGGCGLEGLGQVEQGFEIASNLILSHPKDLFSHLLSVLCSFIIFFDQRPTNSKQHIYILQNKIKKWFLVISLEES